MKKINDAWFMFLFTLFIIFYFFYPAYGFEAQVVHVVDGDTITVNSKDKGKIKIRLYGIDCPEKTQAYGTAAKYFTYNMVYNKKVWVEQVDVGWYGRVIAWVYTNKEDVSLNEKLVKVGLAWHYKKYSDDEKLSLAEALAKRQQIGIWYNQNPMPPWQYRKQ